MTLGPVVQWPLVQCTKGLVETLDGYSWQRGTPKTWSHSLYSATSRDYTLWKGYCLWVLGGWTWRTCPQCPTRHLTQLSSTLLFRLCTAGTRHLTQLSSTLLFRLCTAGTRHLTQLSSTLLFRLCTAGTRHLTQLSSTLLFRLCTAGTLSYIKKSTLRQAYQVSVLLGGWVFWMQSLPWYTRFFYM